MLLCALVCVMQGAPVMDFSLIEKKVLLAAGVTVTFRNLVLANVRCAASACCLPGVNLSCRSCRPPMCGRGIAAVPCTPSPATAATTHSRQRRLLCSCPVHASLDRLQCELCL